MKLSEWFDGAKFVPGSPGLYARKFINTETIVYSRWDGVDWFFNYLLPDEARSSKQVSSFQNLDFAGMVK